MAKVFIDTVALIALTNKNDSLHGQALKVRQRLLEEHYTFVTTTAILLEVGNTFSDPNKGFREAAITFFNTIPYSDRWILVDIDRSLIQEGFTRFEQFKDKSWSLVDCISMVVAKRFNITEIFTKDTDFFQAGFKVLL